MRWNQKADNDILRILLRILQEQNIAIPYADIAAAFGGEITVTAVKKCKNYEVMERNLGE